MEKTDKICPFLKQKCAKGTCAVFNTNFKRCDIGLLAYNLYRFAEALSDLKSNFSAVERSVQENKEEGNETIQNLLNL